MKRLLTVITLAAFTSCSYLGESNGYTLVTVGTKYGLELAFKDSAKRKVVADYIYVYAHAARCITGTPTPEAFMQQLNTFIPANIKNDYPELVAFVTPLISAAYQKAYETYGTNAAKLYEQINRIATALEAGVAAYHTT